MEYLEYQCNPNFIYTGVGASETPEYALNNMRKLAVILEYMGYFVRTGDAPGSDALFRKFNHICIRRGENVEWSNKLALELHKNPPAASKYLSTLGRNPIQVLGRDGKTPSRFVLTYTEPGKMGGGSLLTIAVAKKFNIPIINSYDTSYNEMYGELQNILGMLRCP